jgi:uncharacterized protein
MNKLFHNALIATAMLAMHAQPQAQVLRHHQGRWLGDMQIPDGPKISFGAHFLQRADGSYWASGVEPGRGAYHIPVDAITENGDDIALHFDSASLKLQWDGRQFRGAFHQNGAVMPITLRKVDAFTVRARPQTPRRPFPYQEQYITFNSAPGVTLSATLSTPHGKGPVNAVVLVHGSGPQTRDQEAGGHQQFGVLADFLSRRGIAVLRYDKRGVGYSSGDYRAHTVKDLATDLQAALKTLRARRQFASIGVIATSEGPEVAAAVAARNPGAIDFIVALAGTGLNGLESLIVQDRAYAQDKKASPEEVARLMVYVRNFYTTILAHEETEPRLSALKALRVNLPRSDRDLIDKYEMDQGTLSLDWAAKPFLRASLQSNPPADWRAVRCPVLALIGGVDRQVPPTENLGGLVAALVEGGNTQVESEVLPSLNHLFQTAETGYEEEYAKIDETMAPVALARIAGFVSRQR